MDKKYSEEEVADITEREAKGLQALKDLQLNPSAIVQKIAMKTEKGEEYFVDKITPFLQDLKYANKPVPSNIEDIK